MRRYYISEEDEGRLDNARDNMEIERYRTLSFDEFVEEMMSSPDYKIASDCCRTLSTKRPRPRERPTQRTRR